MPSAANAPRTDIEAPITAGLLASLSFLRINKTAKANAITTNGNIAVFISPSPFPTDSNLKGIAIAIINAKATQVKIVTNTFFFIFFSLSKKALYKK